MSTEVAVLERRAQTYRDWPAEKKAEAILAYEANGYNLKGTARLLNIPPDTLRYWLKDSDRLKAEFQPQNSLHLADKLEYNAHNLADSIAEHDLAIVPLASKATALGIVIDKMQLLRNLPTSITASIERTELTVLLQSALGSAIDSEALSSTDSTD